MASVKKASPSQANGGADHVAEVAHHPRPQQAELEGEDRAAHGAEGEQDAAHLRPALGQDEAGRIAPEAAPVGDEDDGGEGHAERGDDDVPAQAHRHLVSGGEQRVGGEDLEHRCQPPMREHRLRPRRSAATGENGGVTGDGDVVPLTEAGGLDRSVIGAKAASLVQLVALGLPTPPAFVVTTGVWRAHRRDGHLPDGVLAAIDAAVAGLERSTGRRFGGVVDPLLLSVRSGSSVSMPGMLDTVLDVGFGPGTRAALAAVVDDAFARRCHQRFLAGWAAVVPGGEVPADPRDQLVGAVIGVLRSWDNERARAYRQRHGIDDGLGTAVVVQAMVFGDRSPASGTGVAFSRDPDTGRPGLCGDFLPGAQGTDVVAGTHDPQPVRALADVAPDALAELEAAVATLEEATGDMVDVEFTVEDATLHLLQHRPGPRAAAAAVRIAVDLVDDGVIPVDEALRRVSAEQLARAASPTVAPGAPGLLGTGVGACPGVAAGAVCLSPDHVAVHDGPVVLVRHETSPDDIHGMTASAGLLTAHGGLVSHAALVARELDLPRGGRRRGPGDRRARRHRHARRDGPARRRCHHRRRRLGAGARRHRAGDPVRPRPAPGPPPRLARGHGGRGGGGGRTDLNAGVPPEGRRKFWSR